MSDDEKRKILCRDMPVGATWEHHGSPRRIMSKHDGRIEVSTMGDHTWWCDTKAFGQNYGDSQNTSIHLPPTSLPAPEKPLPAPAAPVPSKLHGPMPTGTMPATGAKLTWDAIAEEKPAAPVPTEPLPCPFCGDKADVDGPCALCSNRDCPCSGNFKLAAWNRRTPDPTLAADLLKLRAENARLAKEVERVTGERDEAKKAAQYCDGWKTNADLAAKAVGDLRQQLDAARAKLAMAERERDRSKFLLEQVRCNLGSGTKLDENLPEAARLIAKLLHHAESDRDEARAKIAKVSDAIEPYLLELSDAGKPGIYATDAVALLVADRDRLAARMQKLETLLRDNAVQWSKEVAEILSPAVESVTAVAVVGDGALTLAPSTAGVPAAAPATAGVRVFADSIGWVAIRGRHWFRIYKDAAPNWTIWKDNGDAAAYKGNYPNDRELSPAEVADLLAAHPLPPAPTPAAPQAQWVEAFPAMPTQQPREGGAWVKVGVAT